MAKKNRNDHSDLQKLKHIIQKLKRENASLRKVIARFDLEQYKHVGELIEKHDKVNKNDSLKEHQDRIKKIWECWTCKKGILVFHPIIRKDGNFYFRKCENCGKRSKLKKLTSKTDTSIKNEETES